MHRLLKFSFLALGLVLAACSASDSAKKAKTVDEIYGEGKAAYDEGNWLEAQTKFDVIKLQYPASQHADDAQFYLSEINFERSEYIMAAFNYNQLRRSYPSSEFVREAMYKAALCYDKISLPADRDQENTRKAILAYTDFQSMFMRDSLALESTKRIRDLRDRLAEKYWLASEHYQRTYARRAAIIQLEAVIDEYPDSKWFEPALVTKIRLLADMKRSDEARTAIAAYRRSVKQPQQKDVVDRLEQGLP
jgi:outer membrane protein assembly factor BamD